MLVRGSKITWRQSLIMRMLILSGPGDLFEGMEIIIARTVALETGLRLNWFSATTMIGMGVGFDKTFPSCTSARRRASLAVLRPTEEKY